MSCTIPTPNGPRLALTLIAGGEPRMRLERRLRCAAGGLGLALDLTVSSDPESFGLRYEQTPVVLHDGQILFSGLPRTEKIQAILTGLMGQQ